MKITEVHLGILSAPLRTPFVTALRRVEKIEDLVVAIVTDDGQTGFGEAPPTGVITGDTMGGIVGALKGHIIPAIMGRDPRDLEDLLERVDRAVVHNSSAKAAVDIALYDLAGKVWGIPVWRMLGGNRTRIETDLTISVNDPDLMANDALLALDRGFDTLKLKVGVDPSLDVERLTEVRQAVGPQIKIRIDANQAWKPKQAVRLLDIMAEQGLDIELCEQPVKAEDIDGLRYVTENSPIPVLADESVFSPRDALKIIETRAADFINIKLMKCGGIRSALKICDLAQMEGIECMIGCMLETKLSVNAAVELACARNVITRADLDGPGLCSMDPVLGGAEFNGKNITVSDKPGLGIDGFRDGCVNWLE